MQIYQKNGVTGKLCQRISVAGSVLLSRSIFRALGFTFKLNNNRLSFSLFITFISCPFFTLYTFNFFHNLLLS